MGEILSDKFEIIFDNPWEDFKFDILLYIRNGATLDDSDADKMVADLKHVISKTSGVVFEPR